MFDALIQFEREVGTLEEMDKALEKVNAQVARISKRPQKTRGDSEKSAKRKALEKEEIEIKKKRTEKIETMSEDKELTNGHKCEEAFVPVEKVTCFTVYII